MDTEVTDQQEQAMFDAARALARLTDLMMASLPARAQGQIVELLTNGAKLIINTIMAPYPSFTLLLLPANPHEAAIQLVACAPSADTLHALKSGEIAH